MAMSGTAPDTKVEPAELRSFATSSSENARPVLIQVHMPPVKVQLPRARPGGANRWRGLSFTRSGSDAQEGEANVERIRAELERLGVRARFLPSAEAFAADLKPDQIRRLCTLPSVERILADRERKLKGQPETNA